MADFIKRETSTGGGGRGRYSFGFRACRGGILSVLLESVEEPLPEDICGGGKEGGEDPAVVYATIQRERWR